MKTHQRKWIMVQFTTRSYRKRFWGECDGWLDQQLEAEAKLSQYSDSMERCIKGE